MALKQMRRAKGWSQEQLAEISGVSMRTIQRLEAGDAPGLETQKALAAAFGYSVEELGAQMAESTLQETLEAPVPESDAGVEAMIERHGWRGFLYNLATMMGVVTWLYFMLQAGESRDVIVGYTALMWFFVLLAHFVTLMKAR